MPLHYGVLGLLAEESGYGFKVRVRIEEGIGEQWGEGELQPERVVWVGDVRRDTPHG